MMDLVIKFQIEMELETSIGNSQNSTSIGSIGISTG